MLALSSHLDEQLEEVLDAACAAEACLDLSSDMSGMKALIEHMGGDTSCGTLHMRFMSLGDERSPTRKVTISDHVGSRFSVRCSRVPGFTGRRQISCN